MNTTIPISTATNKKWIEIALAVISFAAICFLYLVLFPGGATGVSNGIYVPLIYTVFGVVFPLLLFGGRGYAEKYGYRRAGLAKSAIVGAALAVPFFLMGYKFAAGPVPPLLFWYMANVLEETYFRGLWQSAGRHLAGPWGAILIQAALFGVYHMVVAGFTPLQALFPFFLGLLSGWIRKDTDNILAPILFHMALVTGMYFAPR